MKQYKKEIPRSKHFRYFQSTIKPIVNNFRFWVPVVLWGGVIFAFSEIPTIPMSTVTWQEFLIKKSAHIVEFGIFAILLYRALLGTGAKKGDAFKYSLTASIIYGILDEYHQSFTPGRTSTIRDVMFDALGAYIGLLFVDRYLPRLKEKSRITAIIHQFIYEKTSGS